jgi:hypothetical protein
MCKCHITKTISQDSRGPQTSWYYPYLLRFSAAYTGPASSHRVNMQFAPTSADKTGMILVILLSALAAIAVLGWLKIGLPLSRLLDFSVQLSASDCGMPSQRPDPCQTRTQDQPAHNADEVHCRIGRIAGAPGNQELQDLEQDAQHCQAKAGHPGCGAGVHPAGEPAEHGVRQEVLRFVVHMQRGNSP